jgi:CRP-like cAMP-binding protein
MEGGVNMIVKETDLFKGLSVESLEKIASQCEEMRFKPQEVIFKSGEKGEGIYILEEGQVDVFVPGPTGGGIHFVISKPGEIIGFMALAEPPIHVASATATSEVKVVKVPLEVLENLISHPSQDALIFLKNLVVLLAQRLRLAYGLVAEEVSRETAPYVPSYG